MVRREIIEEIGGLNERWFMYAEDVEWSARMLATGRKLYLVPAAVVEHHSGASTEQHAQGHLMPIGAGRDLFIQMNRPSRLTLLLHDAITTCGFSIRAVGYFLRSLFAGSKHAAMWRSRALTFLVYARIAAGLSPRRGA